MEEKRFHHVSDLRKGLEGLINGQKIDPGLAVDLGTYRTYGDIAYVESLTALASDQLDAWYWR